MSDREQDSWRVNFWEVDQGRSRCGMGEIEGKDDSGRSWPGAVDMLENGFAGPWYISLSLSLRARK